MRIVFWEDLLSFAALVLLGMAVVFCMLAA